MDRLRVVTLNIWNRLGPWESRRRLIRRGLKTLDADVVGLQEVLRHDADPIDQACDLADGLGYYVAYASAWHIGDGLHFGNAILSRFPIIGADGFRLPVRPGDEHRGLLFAELDAPCGRVPVFNTHLTWELHLGAVRRQQVLFIADRVAELAPMSGLPPVVMGDFNAEPDSDEIRFLRGLATVEGRSAYFADAFAVAGDGSAGYTFSRRNPFAAAVCEPNRRLDYIFVRGPDRQLRGEPLSARVVLDEAEEGCFPSDHFGVLAEIQVAPRKISL
jgi:endonuclease/exonuclease/phosphatase family metal-dependent hydrolase